MLDQALKEERLDVAVQLLGRESSTDGREVERLEETYVKNNLGLPEPLCVAMQYMDGEVLDTMLGHTHVESAQDLFDTYGVWHETVFGEIWHGGDHKHFKEPVR